MPTPGLGADESCADAMQDIPFVLSVGQRVLHQDFSFIWIKKKKRCFILPHGGVAFVSTGRTRPYYDENYRRLRL